MAVHHHLVRISPISPDSQHSVPQQTIKNPHTDTERRNFHRAVQLRCCYTEPHPHPTHHATCSSPGDLSSLVAIGSISSSQCTSQETSSVTEFEGQFPTPSPELWVSGDIHLDELFSKMCSFPADGAYEGRQTRL